MDKRKRKKFDEGMLQIEDGLKFAMKWFYTLTISFMYAFIYMMSILAGVVSLILLKEINPEMFLTIASLIGFQLDLFFKVFFLTIKLLIYSVVFYLIVLFLRKRGSKDDIKRRPTTSRRIKRSDNKS